MEITITPLLPANARPQYIPLSFSQEICWFNKGVDDKIKNHIPLVLYLKGNLDREGLANALTQIVNRQESLRTVILENDGVLYQNVMPKDGFIFSVIDGAAYEKDSKDLQKRIQQLIDEPFDLSKDHLLRVALIKIKDEEHYLVVTMHPAAADEDSVTIFFHELSEFYNSKKENRLVELNTLQFQYTDYSIWQRNYLHGPVLEISLNYWKEYLKGLELVELPIDRDKSTTQYTRKVSNSVSFDELLLPRLQELGRDQNISLSTILLSAFKVLLFRYSGQNDICVVNQVPARKQTGTECLVGSFPNKLAIRTNINGDDSFIDLLKMVATSLNNSIEHQDLPLEKLINTLAATQDNISPLFRFMFGFRAKTCKCKRSLNELEISVSRYENTYDQSGLSFIITETDQGLFGSITYNADLNNSEGIDLMIAHYIELLHAIINQPNQKIGALPMVTAAEEKKLLVDFNDTYSAFPKNKSLVEVFEEMVEINPGNIAVVFGTDKLTYRQLSERSNQLAHYLTKKGVKENTLVPICIRRSVELIVGILGVLKCGAAYVPIDPEYPLERINHILKDSSNGILICNNEYQSKLKPDEKNQLIEIDSDWSRILDEPKTNLRVNILPGSLAYVIYTSGSTGIPKGAMIEHRNIVSLVKGVNYVHLTEKEIVLSTGSPSFDATTFEYWGVLLNGGQLVLCSENTLLDISLLKAAIRSHEITMMWFTSSWFNQLVDFDISIFETLQTVLVGGEKLSEEYIGKFRKAFPAIEIINGYGPTENTTFSLTHSIRESDINGAIPIGTPLNNRTVYLVNEFSQLVPVGFPGEILLGGAGVGRGYLNQAELTAQKFIPNPFNGEPGERLYKSGDLGKWLPNGTVAYLGRLDGQVKIRGYRIELGEIEIAMNGLSEVSSSCVVVKDDINSTKKMVAYYIPDQSVLKIKEHELYLQLIASWKELYEIEYAKTEVSEDINPEFNIIGWNDSFTGKPIPAEHMQEWLKDIIEVIMTEEPGNVLEIGSGTGLIYYQLAGKVKKYTGTDFSRSSINQISERIGKGLKDYGPTELFVCPAHEISLSETEKADTIILNSIIQYFPGEDYLTDVIAKSLSLLSGHGRIIIGDVRDNRLLHLFKGRLLLNKLVESRKSMKTKDFNWTIKQEALKEEELCVSPDYFYNLKSVFPEISHIEIKWKQGSYLNELSLYRFTVVIHVGTSGQSFKPNWQDWNDIEDKQVIINQLYEENIIAIKDVPNPRLWQERLLTVGLQDNSITSTSDLSKLMGIEDIEMIQLKDILTQLVVRDYTCRFLMHEDKFKMNLVIAPKSSNLLVEDPYNIKTADAGILFTNIPLFNDIRSMLQKEIRVELQQSLPEFMIPAEFIALNYLPLNKNGKADRSFLSLLEDTASSNIVNFKNPETKEQIELAAIWKELFNRDRISLDDDFFEIGGHSLLAMRLVVEINKQLQVNITMNDLFRNPSLRDLALYIQAQKNKVNASSNNHASLLPIKPGTKKVPLYMVCGGGGTVFKFKDFADMLDENQPVYGLQQPIEIKNLKEFPDTIEGIAAKYIEEIINQNPDGPYALSGHCLGGIIAFEMAKQLEGRGKEVKLLVMFDTVIGEVVKPAPPSIQNFYNVPLIVKKLMSKLILKIHFQTFLLRKYTKYSIGHKMQKVKSLAVFEGMYEAENLELKVFKKLEDIYLKAYKNYHITPYWKDIILFYAKEHYFFWDKENDVKFKRVTLDDQTKNQWKHYVKSVTTYEVEGEHSTIFYRENAKEFAQLVQHHLDIGK